MFATDRDLLVFEPGLFGEVAWVGQRLVNGTGEITGSALVMTSQDNGFDSTGVGAGSVVLAGGTSYEVVSRTSGTALAISRLRSSVTAAVLPPAALAAGKVQVFTFAPQIGMAHARALALLGVTDAAAIVNGSELSAYEALSALHLIFAGASAHSGPRSPAGQRAEWYRVRAEAERQRVVAEVDTDGDGVAESVRRPGVGRFVRV
ncbi:MAG: hypothetical protein AAF297_06035 [Planctomycetota bacterium]